MKLKQINCLFRDWFTRPKAELRIRIFSDAHVHTDAKGTGAEICELLEHILTDKQLRPYIDMVQIKIVKEKIGVDPREIISSAMESAMHEHFGKPVKVKRKERAVN